MRISRELEAMLKKPLGKVVPFERAAELAQGRRVVAVGDEVVFGFLESGAMPFVSVFDFKIMRKPARMEVREKIANAYPNPARMGKAAGELNDAMFAVAREMLGKGGGLFVDGEEDLFALPFALLIEEEVVVYGQPGEGCVLVEKGSFARGEIEKELVKTGLVLAYGDEGKVD
jgi:uncharacterized protein (UPF0218 family)